MEWIAYCEDNHDDHDPPQTYHPAALKLNSKTHLKFRLIDAQDMCIVYAERDCRYIALSYIWGHANDGRLLLSRQNEELLMHHGALRNEQAAIPQTILDAILVVRRLKERYLWVDSLCLLQDDSKELDQCTAFMDLFYEMAIFTIVAGGGSDAHAGLPGVPPTPRKLSRTIREIVPGLRMTTTRNCNDVLRRSTYATRAWTMQEELLSSRLLIFVNNQVYFRCEQALYSEEMNWQGVRLTNSSLVDGSDASIFSWIVALRTGLATSFWAFSMMMRHYTKRKLTYSADVLRAARGMLRKYSLITDTHCFEGMSCPLEQSLLFQIDYEDVSNTASRREGFPSYSWTGWNWGNSIAWPWELKFMEMIKNDEPLSSETAEENEFSQETIKFRTWIVWHFISAGKVCGIDSTGSPKGLTSSPTLEQAQMSSKALFQGLPASGSDDATIPRTASEFKYPTLLFCTVCVNLKLRINTHTIWNEAERQHVTAADPVSKCDAGDGEGLRCGDVSLDMPLAHTSAKATFALLAQSNRGFWALMLEWKDGIAERRGQAILSPDVLDRCLPPGPRWRTIILG
ncbi:MAG: hypothetical protein M1822_001305 [Bathelium mastoideum]|nr:MAG: hypothetical protein M1822_001305 [Bathelium mastoideum]